jgi:hypothetical protein
MGELRSGRATAGVVLILLGVVLLASQLIDGFGEVAWTFIIGGLFVAGYFYRRAYGLLIPGCLLLGIGIGNLGEVSSFDFGEFDSVGLGLGFVAIFAIDYLYRGHSSWWPLIPGTILVVTGLAAGNQTARDVLAAGWPVVVILIGLAILAGAFRRSSSEV